METQINLADYLRILYRGRWIIIVSFAVVFIVTLWYTFTADPVYEASTTVMIASDNRMESMMFDMTYFGNKGTLIANQMEVLRSRTVSERVIKRLDLSDVRDSISFFQPNPDGEYLTLRGMVKTLQDNMEVTHKKETDIVTLTFKAGSPFEASYITNAIADEYRQANAEANRSEISALREFIENQLARKQEELRLSEERLRDYQEQEKVASLDEETSELVSRLSEVEAMLEEAQISLQANLEMKASLQRQLEERRKNLSADLSQISTPYIVELQKALATAVSERTKYMTAVQTEIQDANRRHFEANLKNYDDKINALRSSLQEESAKISVSSMVQDPFQVSQELIQDLIKVDAEIQSNSAKINALLEVVTEYNSKMESLPVKVLELARLERRRMVDEQTFMMMTQKLEETKIQEAGQSHSVMIIDEAIEPLDPISPKKKLNLALGLLLGLGLGIGLTFLIEYFDNTVKTHEELERLGYNILASIPKIEMDKYERKLEARMEKMGPMEGRKIEARLITHLDPKSPISEAYRTLRTNLQFSKVERKLRTVLVTSSGPKEGKSTTAANLAIAMAQAGNRTVLLDGDLRRPVVHSIFGLEKDNGITNLLMDAIPYTALAKDTFHENLKIVTSGILPPNPSELLSSQKMQNLLNKLQEDFDIIIIDSPPVIAVTDAAILSTKVDGTILVVSSGQTNREALARAHVLLDNVDTRFLGVLLNNVDVEGMYGSYYYYYYYHYYSKPGQKRKRRVSRSQA